MKAIGPARALLVGPPTKARVRQTLWVRKKRALALPEGPGRLMAALTWNVKYSSAGAFSMLQICEGRDRVLLKLCEVRAT